MSGLLELQEITRTFTVPDSEPLQILTGVDLSVSPGEHVAIVGRSGTGKSTLLNILGLIDKPTSGHYTLSGTDTSRLGESRRAHLRGRTFGFVFQSFNLIPGLSTTENVAAPLLYDTGRAFWTRSARAAELLAVAGRAHTQYRLDHGTLTPISVTRRQVGSLEEFDEVVTPPTSPYSTVPISHEGAS